MTTAEMLMLNLQQRWGTTSTPTRSRTRTRFIWEFMTFWQPTLFVNRDFWSKISESRFSLTVFQYALGFDIKNRTREWHQHYACVCVCVSSDIRLSQFQVNLIDKHSPTYIYQWRPSLWSKCSINCWILYNILCKEDEVEEEVREEAELDDWEQCLHKAIKRGNSEEPEKKFRSY